MKYKDFLIKLKVSGLVQVSRQRAGKYIVVLIGRYSEAVFPFAFSYHPLILDEEMDTLIEKEMLVAILRRFDINPAEIF